MHSRAALLERLQFSLVQGVLIFLAVISAVALRHSVFASAGNVNAVSGDAYLAPAIWSAAVFMVLLWPARTRWRRQALREELVGVSRVVAIGTAVILAITFFYRGASYSRASALLFLPMAVIALMVASRLHAWLLGALGRNENATRRVVIVGSGDPGRYIGRELSSNPTYYRLVGFLADESTAEAGNEIGGVPVLGSTKDLSAVVTEFDVDEVILAMGSAPDDEVLDVIGECMRLRVEWKLVPPLLGLLFDRVDIDQVAGLPMVGRKGSRLVGHNWFVKRTVDVVISTVALVILAPLVGLVAIGIKATSRGPVIYRQIRVGSRGRRFTFFKFRTMSVDALSESHREYADAWILGKVQGDDNGGVYKLAQDERITRIGRLLRATSLDEIPQLWNVLRGDMSLVGPRPPLPYEVERYTEWHKRRLEVPPGITGLWQVSGRNTLSFEEMVRLDIDYIEQWRPSLDAAILLRTVPAVLFNRGH
ncbi:MAG: sugar transferase [Acidimicrobiia bacterium]|nr:sugar transferase [Acidimicrobiia bacterium]MDH3469956.1 sugar transferase [Acidimicrobiia bacterium]